MDSEHVKEKTKGRREIWYREEYFSFYCFFKSKNCKKDARIHIFS